MRVTENTNFQTIHDSIHRSKSRMEKDQIQASTMKRLNTPSDDPIGAAKILELRTDKLNNEQFFMNSKMAEAHLNNTDHVLSELTDIIVRAKEIALGQSSGASSNDQTRLGVSEEIAQLYKQAVSAANKRVGDRYIFGGYKTDRAPVDPEGNYQGDSGEMLVEISRDVFIPMNIPGLEAFNTAPASSSDSRHLAERESKLEDSRRTQQVDRSPSGEKTERGVTENVNIFDELQNLRISLLTGDIEGVHSTLERFDAIHGQIVSSRAKVGSRINGLQSTIEALSRHNITSAELSSVIEDADMAKVMSDLAKEETVFRSALGSSQRLVQPTLMDFLK